MQEQQRETIRKAIVDNYNQELSKALKEIKEKYKLSDDRIKSIEDNSSKYLEIDDIVNRAAEKNKNANVDFQTASWLSEGLKKLGLSNRDQCIIKHVAIGAAIIAAWVASGGTLIIGTTLQGVVITETLHAALAGGASGRVLAEIMCGK